MSKDEVDSIRKRSKSSGNGPWVTDYDEMAKKTVFRRLSKWLPQSPEMQKAFDIDDADFIKNRQIIDISAKDEVPPEERYKAVEIEAVEQIEEDNPQEEEFVDDEIPEFAFNESDENIE